MNLKSHILPATIAAALHGLVFLPYPCRPGQPASSPGQPPVPPVDVLRVDVPEPPAADDPADDNTVPTVRRGAQAPEIPNPPVPPRPEEFTVDVPAARFPPDPVGPLGRPGQPDGFDVENRPGVGRPLLPASELDRRPRATVQLPPDYPGGLRQAGIGGEVLVEFTVDTSGRVATARVLRSTRADFEEPTRRAVLRWRFEPGRKNGRAVSFRMVVPVEFSVAGL